MVCACRQPKDFKKEPEKRSKCEKNWAENGLRGPFAGTRYIVFSHFCRTGRRGEVGVQKQVVAWMEIAGDWVSKGMR